jgi:hypothetical protein
LWGQDVKTYISSSAVSDACLHADAPASERGNLLSQEARHSREAHLPKGSSFIEYIKEWVRLKGILSPESATTVSHECERLLRATDRAALQKPSTRYKLLLHALLSANRRTADMVYRVGPWGLVSGMPKTYLGANSGTCDCEILYTVGVQRLTPHTVCMETLF